MKADNQNNTSAAMAGYKLLYEMINKPREGDNKETFRVYKRV